MDRVMMLFPPPEWAEYQRHREEIAGILDPRCHTIEWLDAQIIAGEALTFGSDDAAIIVTVKQHPAGGRELHGLAAAGNVRGIIALIEQAEDWGRSVGLDFACISSRPAWARLLKSRGYDVKRVEIAKDL